MEDRPILPMLEIEEKEFDALGLRMKEKGL
jgi:hypothetical protein